MSSDYIFCSVQESQIEILNRDPEYFFNNEAFNDKYLIDNYSISFAIRIIDEFGFSHYFEKLPEMTSKKMEYFLSRTVFCGTARGLGNFDKCPHLLDHNVYALYNQNTIKSLIKTYHEINFTDLEKIYKKREMSFNRLCNHLDSWIKQLENTLNLQKDYLIIY